MATKRPTKAPSTRKSRTPAKRPGAAKRSHSSPHVKKRAFLAALARTGNVSEAARAARCDRGCYYDWRENDEAFKAAAAAALEEAADLLEAEARRRAADGVREPIFYRGRKVATVLRYSDTLLIFLLKGIRPEKFRERHELSGPGGAPLSPPTFSVVLSKASE
ncbi:MAG: terminase [Rhodocyclaceae bacterium]|jgi:transposase-like protein|nr:terminase [Rhodocyclaceae bacterium]